MSRRKGALVGSGEERIQFLLGVAANLAPATLGKIFRDRGVRFPEGR